LSAPITVACFQYPGVASAVVVYGLPVPVFWLPLF